MNTTTCEACGSPKYLDMPVTLEPDSIGTPAAAYAALKPYLRSRKQESVVVVFLDAKNRPIGKPLTVSLGTLNTTRTHPRDIFRPAIERSALAFIMAHNHPSGSLDVSREDVEFTTTTAKAGALIGIPLHDHLIISRRGFVSFRERGLL